LVREYFPKGTDLSVHADEHVKQVCDELNAKPRKSLVYLSPAAALGAE
jgi:IS30 family transposase